MEETNTIILKPPKTYIEQLEIYKSRGLIVNDENCAISTLKRFNYYRLRGYTLSLMENDTFKSNVKFKDISDLYHFDMRLRILLLSSIEYVEIAFRTHIAYLIAHSYGPLGYKNSNNFNNQRYHSDFINKLEKLILESKEIFVAHHREKYNNNHPSWEAFEVLTFSSLSLLFKNLKTRDKKDISNEYYNGLPYEHIESWLHSLTVIRNTCAHYSRLFNRRLSIRPKMLREDHEHNINNNELFSIIYNLKYLITDKTQWESWVIQLEALIEEYNEVDIKLMGFPDEWKTIIK